MIGQPVGVLELFGLLRGLGDGGSCHLDGFGGKPSGGQICVGFALVFVLGLPMLGLLMHGGNVDAF